MGTLVLLLSAFILVATPTPAASAQRPAAPPQDANDRLISEFDRSIDEADKELDKRDRTILKTLGTLFAQGEAPPAIAELIKAGGILESAYKADRARASADNAEARYQIVSRALKLAGGLWPDVTRKWFDESVRDEQGQRFIQVRVSPLPPDGQ